MMKPNCFAAFVFNALPYRATLSSQEIRDKINHAPAGKVSSALSNLKKDGDVELVRRHKGGRTTWRRVRLVRGQDDFQTPPQPEPAQLDLAVAETQALGEVKVNELLASLLVNLNTTRKVIEAMRAPREDKIRELEEKNIQLQARLDRVLGFLSDAGEPAQPGNGAEAGA